MKCLLLNEESSPIVADPCQLPPNQEASTRFSPPSSNLGARPSRCPRQIRPPPGPQEDSHPTCSAATLSKRIKKSTPSLLAMPIPSFTFFKSSEIPDCKEAACLRPLPKNKKSVLILYSDQQFTKFGISFNPQQLIGVSCHYSILQMSKLRLYEVKMT